MRYLTIALTKGRLASKTLELLEKTGITCEEMKDKNTRKLILSMRRKNCGSFWLKGRMCPPMWSTEQRISVW